MQTQELRVYARSALTGLTLGAWTRNSWSQTSIKMLFCIDSDGCVFDNMRWKHEYAFLPAFVEVWGLNARQEHVAEHWYKINLYSRTRGINRFAAFGKCFRALMESDEGGLSACLPGDLDAYERFIVNPANRNAEAIRREADRVAGFGIFEQALHWSDQVNRRVREMGVTHQPFPNAIITLRKMASLGEVHVVSQAPHETLQAEWNKARLAGLATRILGQEYGSKSEQVHVARNGRNIPTLLVGDAPGDELAANAADCLFFPIIPQQEDGSWRKLIDILEHEGSRISNDHPVLQLALTEFHSFLGE